MQLITSQALAQAVEHLKTGESEHVAHLLAYLTDKQPFLLEYVTRPELASELGREIEAWISTEEELLKRPLNLPMLGTLASLMAVALEFVQDIPRVDPSELIHSEQAMGPQLILLATNKHTTGEELVDFLVNQCRQRDLLNFALDIRHLFHEQSTATARQKGRANDSSDPLRELIKLRVIVDTLDCVTEPPADRPDDTDSPEDVQN